MAIDGMNVLEVERKMRDAIEHARAGEGPYIIEAITYRYRGHSMSDPATYRTRNEVEEWRKGRDPIAQLQHLMTEAGLSDEDAFKEKDREIKKAVAAVAKAAEQQPEPDPSELWTDIINDPIEHAYPYPGRVS